MGEERGAVSVIVAVALVALLGFAAIVIDVGALYAERAELQSGADAAALAIAEDCAGGNCGDETATAQSFANQNAKDDAANVDPPTFPTATSVRVRATTRDSGGAGSLALTLAPVLGIDEETVSATSTATWGNPAGGPAALPLAFSPCVFEGMLDGPMQVIRTHGGPAGSTCVSTSPSGQTLPGGFSWLETASGTCTTYIDINTTVSSSPGSSIPGTCSTEVLKPSLVGQTVLLPMYDDRSGTGSGVTYHIYGWAAFKIHGWSFPGNSWNNTGIPGVPGTTCTGSCNGIIGQFVTFTELGPGFTTDPSAPDLGATVVSLTE